jgi:4-amino-4-deoxy-L-arabinose transferase-like glycosyltransferase
LADTLTTPTRTVKLALPTGLLGLLLLIWLLCLQGLGARELSSSHEARAGQNAVSIVAENCWGLPHLLDGTVEMQKPPLYYWLVACCAWLHGGIVDACAVRLPASLAALGNVLMIFVLGVLAGRRTAGLIAAAVLGSMVHFTHLAQVGRIDMPLCLSTTLALSGYYLAQKRATESTRWYIITSFAFAAGLLLKGPIALVLPGCAVVAMQVFRSRSATRLGRVGWHALSLRRAWSSPARPSQAQGVPPGGSLDGSGRSSGLGFQLDELGLSGSPSKTNLQSLLWAIALALAVAAPWYVYAGVRTGGEFYRVFFLYHNLERGLGGDGPLATHPFWFYAVRILVDLLPWGIALPPLLWFFWRKRLWRLDAEAWFGLVWFVSMTVLLSLMRFKRADYLLPAYPGAALFVGCVAERWYRALGEPRAGRVGFVVVLLATAAAWQAFRTWSTETVNERHQRVFAEELCRRLPPRVPVIFFRVEAHQLAFHLGRRYNTVLEWENLDTWAGSGKNYFVVMTPECERDLSSRVRQGRLERLLDSHDLFPHGPPPDRPLVLLRNEPPDASARR